MTNSTGLFLYVRDVAASVRFYGDLFDIQPVQASPAFAMLVLPSGVSLGLWSTDDVKPAVEGDGGGHEIGFKVDDAAAVDQHCAEWWGKGAKIALPPTDLGFGRSFVALDPDNHRLRVYAPIVR